MLGFGASGAVLAASEKLAKLDRDLAWRSSLLGALSVPFMLIVISKVPFAPFQILKEPQQFAYMILYYIAVTLPFFCAGLTISSIFRSIPREATRIYFWDLTGAGMGCLAIVAAINIFGAPGVVAVSASLFLLAAAFFFDRGFALRRILIVVAALAWIPIGSNVERALDFKASKEKWISTMPNKKITFSKWSPIFRVDAYDIISDDFEGTELFGIRKEDLEPGTKAAFIAHDGDACAMMVKSDRDLSAFAAFEKSILKPPYLITENSDVLIIGPGGGVDVGMAVRNKANSVLAVELDPITIDLVANSYADFVGHLYEQPGVKVVADEGRSFLRRSEDKFDLVQLTGMDTLAAANSGAYVLAENYLYTVEAYNDFMDRLNADGILCLVILDLHYKKAFPRHAVRQVALSVAALRKRGIDNPGRHIAVIASSQGDPALPWVSILSKMTPFTRLEVGKLAEFADQLSFDCWHLPGKTPDNLCAYIATWPEEDRREFFESAPLKLTAPTDNMPFFFHFYKWRSLPGSLEEIDTGHSLATGQLILLLILILSVVFSAALIIYPLARFQKVGLGSRSKWNYIIYFTALGLGFIFLEISYIQKFILFLGYPTYSLSVILFSLLTFSGIGSYLSGRLPLSPRKVILVAVGLLSIVALGYIFVLPLVFNHFLAASRQVRIMVSLIFLFPLGLLLGMFFPMGIRIIAAENKRFIPWAWGVNGFASVIGTVLAIILAMSYGFNVITVLAVAIYLMGVCAMLLAGNDQHLEDS